MTSHDLTDAQIERILRGDGADADLAASVATLRALALKPSEASAARAGGALATVAAGTPVPLIGPAATSPSRWRMRAAIAGGVALLGAALVGTAAAADDAAPGDALYSIDRALEDVGVGDGGDEERIEEALELTEDGDSDGALELLAEEVDDTDETGSSAALLAAAAAIRENGSEASAEVHARVAAMLEWMASTDATGSPSLSGTATGR